MAEGAQDFQTRHRGDDRRLAPAQAKRLRGGLNWLHILAFWPLPVLLGFHVLKTYYY